MKKYLQLKYLSFSLLLIALAGGCTDGLDDVTPQNALNRTLVLTDPNAAMTLHSGVYSAFRGYHGTLFQLGEMRSDIWAGGLFTEAEDAGLRNYYTHNIGANQVPAGNWAGFYSLLDKINTVIALFPEAPVTEAQRSTVLAEMHGLRAYVYYTMLKTWGGVVITTEPVTRVGSLPELYRARSSPEEVMALVKADIERSLALFGGQNTFAPKRIYWNRAATLTLKGDVHIWSGTHQGGGTADFTVARQALEEVQAIPNLGLQENYANIFNPTTETNNKEIIFAINFERDQAMQRAYGNFFVNTTQASALLLDPLTNSRRVSDAYPLVAGANRAGLSAAMIAKLSDPKDQRIRNTFQVMYRNNPPTYPIAGTLLTKFIGRVDGGAQTYDNDFPVYRFADVLLLLAEAKTKSGLSPAAEINLIRQRAYGPDYTRYVNGSQDENMRAILEEDLREFIGEGRRWWSLRRAGDKWVFEYINPLYLSAAQAHKLLLPISVGMLNSDPMLRQTPGY
jgi:starch-binding outer membrane protein, SusD/RagB family